MTLVLHLLLAHYLADFYLQPYAWVLDKVKNKECSKGLLKHISVHFCLTLLALISATNTLDWRIAITLLFIVSTHYAIDIWKTYRPFSFRYYAIDQIAHHIVIGCSVIILHDLFDERITTFLLPWFNESTLLVLLAYITLITVSINPIMITTMVILKSLHVASSNKAQKMGYLERLGVLVALILGGYWLIPCYIALKSVWFLKFMPHASASRQQQFVVGTLSSISLMTLFSSTLLTLCGLEPLL